MLFDRKKSLGDVLALHEACSGSDTPQRIRTLCTLELKKVEVLKIAACALLST